MSDNHLPIPEAYWVEPGRFLAGEYPGLFDSEQTRKRLDALLEAGIDTFIDLTRENENIPYETILKEQSRIYNRDAHYYRYAIGDFGLPTPELMKAILDKIDQSLQAGRRVYVHCWGGIGRTGTTVGCYLVRRGLSGEDALRQLASWWREVPKSRVHSHSPETLEQRVFVRDWSRHENAPKDPG